MVGIAVYFIALCHDLVDSTIKKHHRNLAVEYSDIVTIFIPKSTKLIDLHTTFRHVSRHW